MGKTSYELSWKLKVRLISTFSTMGAYSEMQSFLVCISLIGRLILLRQGHRGFCFVGCIHWLHDKELFYFKDNHGEVVEDAILVDGIVVIRLPLRQALGDYFDGLHPWLPFSAASTLKASAVSGSLPQTKNDVLTELNRHTTRMKIRGSVVS